MIDIKIIDIKKKCPEFQLSLFLVVSIGSYFIFEMAVTCCCLFQSKKVNS